MSPRLWRSQKRVTFFPLKKKYDLVNRTLEGAVHRLHEPGDFTDLDEFHETDKDRGLPSAPPGSVADSSGIPSARDAPPDTTAAQSGFPSALDPAMSDRDTLLGPVERWALDKRGHRYNVDELCDKMVNGSARPPEFPKYKWNNISRKGIHEVMASARPYRS